MRGSSVRGVLALALVFAAAALQAGNAAATFHEISIREVYAGSSAQLSSQYVELQAWSAGQNFVAGHSVTTYDESGNLTDTATFPAMVPNGANQITILIATPAAEAQFGVVADKVLVDDALSPSGGAVCWETLDCVSWGGFSGSKLLGPAGAPAAAIPDGMALRRTIAPGCPTLLEAGDDHDNSAADFSPVFPAPRPNSVVPSERACPRSGGGQSGGDGGDTRGAPQTILRRKPAKKTRDPTPTFRFGSDESKSTFQCKVDAKPFRTCRSPFTTRQLTHGRHTFKVRARDESGKLDPTPASYRFRVIAKPRARA